MSPPWTLGYASPLGGAGGAPAVAAFWKGPTPAGYAAKKVVVWAFKLGTFLREICDDYMSGDERDLERQRRRWRGEFVERYIEIARQVSADAFDQLAGGNASHGQLPELTPEANLHLRGLLQEVGDGWVEKMERIAWIERELAKAPGSLYEPTDAERAQWEKGNPSASELEELKAQMQADLDRIIAFETNPANWKLTDEQVARLPEEWRERFERRESLQASIDEVHGGFAPADSPLAASMNECRDEMAREARSLYEYGPEVVPEFEPPRYGPDPPPTYGPPAPTESAR